MKYITLAILSLFCLGIKAQTTNAHEQYMVKTATWKSYGGQSSFKMDLGYYQNGNLKEVTKITNLTVRNAEIHILSPIIPKEKEY